MSEKFFGKYRGLVLNNIDPMQMNRLQVQVPDVAGLIPTTWAMPCVPVAGLQNGMVALPIIGSGVWIEFEQGDPDFPIWTGGFWGLAADVPVAALTPAPIPPGQNIVLQTHRPERAHSERRAAVAGWWRRRSQRGWRSDDRHE